MQYEMIRNRDGSATVTVYVDELDFARSMPHDHPHWAKLTALLDEYSSRPDQGATLTEQENQELVDLWQVEAALNAKLDRLSDRYVVKGGRLFKDADPMDENDPWVQQVIRFRDEGVNDWAPLIRFQDNLDANPNPHSREQLYRFLSKYPITITDDGMLVLYKGALNRSQDEDDFEMYPFQSKGSGPDTIVDDVEQPNGRIKQGIGSVVEHPRSLVHFNPQVACSNGLHCGTYNYAHGFSSEVVLRVIVNPRDVVNVPEHDHKVRVCRYIVDAVAADGAYQEALLVQQKKVADGESAVTKAQDPAEAPYVPAEATYDGDGSEKYFPIDYDVSKAQIAEYQKTDPGAVSPDGKGLYEDYCFGCKRRHTADECENAEAPEPVNNQEVTPVTTAAPKSARKRYPTPRQWDEIIERKRRRRKSLASLVPENWVLTGDDPNERKSWEVQPKR